MFFYLLLLLSFKDSLGAHINITMLSNCVDIPLHYSEANIEIRDIKYEANKDGFIDTVHGIYSVRKQVDSKNTELILTSYSCPASQTGVCKENAVEFVEQMDCERFHNDQSGPWTMFALAMDEKNKCAEKYGDFELNGAIMKWKYLEKYMDNGPGRYRLRMLAHIVGENRELIHYRGCIELDFDVV